MDLNSNGDRHPFDLCSSSASHTCRCVTQVHKVVMVACKHLQHRSRSGTMKCYTHLYATYTLYHIHTDSFLVVHIAGQVHGTTSCIAQGMRIHDTRIWHALAYMQRKAFVCVCYHSQQNMLPVCLCAQFSYFDAKQNVVKNAQPFSEEAVSRLTELLQLPFSHASMRTMTQVQTTTLFNI